MNDYAYSWLELIHLRDNFYLAALLLAAVGLFWYKQLAARVRHLFMALLLGAALVMVLAWGWGLSFSF
jgi:hypothetical protein